jgi:hypothetical protein
VQRDSPAYSKDLIEVIFGRENLHTKIQFVVDAGIAMANRTTHPQAAREQSRREKYLSHQ